MTMSKKTLTNSKSNAALRQALMRVKPEYFSWSQEEQEHYGLNIPDNDDFRIRQSLYKTLFDIEAPTQEALDSLSHDFGDDEDFLFNNAILPLYGIGEDNFFLNEYLDGTLLDFKTLHDYCYDDHLFQEEVRQKDFPDKYKPSPYQGRLYCRWARLTIDGAFYYALLWSQTEYLMNSVDDISHDKIKKLIPYEFVEGSDHGKREGKGTILNMKRDASGLEDQLEELQDRYHKYTEKRYIELSDDFDKKAPQTIYMINESQENDPHINFIFSDKTALEDIRFKCFMRDCQRIVGNNDALLQMERDEKKAAVEYLEQQYHDIMKNFDSKITKFRKKRKIIVADGAFDNLT